HPRVGGVAWFPSRRGTRPSPPPAVRAVEIRLRAVLARVARPAHGAVLDPLHTASAPPVRGAGPPGLGGRWRREPLPGRPVAGRRAAHREPPAAGLRDPEHGGWAPVLLPGAPQRADPQLPDCP